MKNIAHANQVLDRVSLKLDALKILFNTTTEHLHVDSDTVVFDNSINLKTVFENKNSAVSVVHYTKSEVGHPLHYHYDLVEYLIVTKGKFALKTDTFMRVMVKGECASIPAGMLHTTICLEDEGELLAICIPPESAYSNTQG